MISFNKGEYGKHTFFHQGISDSILSRFLKLRIIKIDFKISFQTFNEIIKHKYIMQIDHA